jgi:hypothetical protein
VKLGNRHAATSTDRDRGKLAGSCELVHTRSGYCERPRRVSAYTIRVKNGQYVSVSATIAFLRLGPRSWASASARMSCGTARNTSVTRMIASDAHQR